MPGPLASVQDELTALAEAGLARRMRVVRGPQSAELEVDGRRVINFASNDYLGLAAHPLLGERARRAIEAEGFGAGSSRLICGNLTAHRALEDRLATWTRTPAALLFNSGYQANLGAISALAGPDDVVFSDALNHASIIDGCRLARVRVVVYRHADPEDLAHRLTEHPGRRRFIVSESLFSMDGDRAPLARLSELAKAHDALLIVDDAHALGVFGPEGSGLCAGHKVDLQVGTFGKALGGFGAFVAGAQPLVELILHRARSFVFTTALPVPVVEAARGALEWLATDEAAHRRARLLALGQRFHEGLLELGYRVPGPASHIVPLRVRDGDPRRAMEASEALLAQGVYAQGIRAPTVPVGTSRVRFSLMATHGASHLDAALRALAAVRPLFDP